MRAPSSYGARRAVGSGAARAANQRLDDAIFLGGVDGVEVPLHELGEVLHAEPVMLQRCKPQSADPWSEAGIPNPVGKIGHLGRDRDDVLSVPRAADSESVRDHEQPIELFVASGGSGRGWVDRGHRTSTIWASWERHHEGIRITHQVVGERLRSVGGEEAELDVAYLAWGDPSGAGFDEIAHTDSLEPSQPADFANDTVRGQPNSGHPPSVCPQAPLLGAGAPAVTSFPA